MDGTPARWICFDPTTKTGGKGCKNNIIPLEEVRPGDGGDTDGGDAAPAPAVVAPVPTFVCLKGEGKTKKDCVAAGGKWGCRLGTKARPATDCKAAREEAANISDEPETPVDPAGPTRAEITSRCKKELKKLIKKAGGAERARELAAKPVRAVAKCVKAETADAKLLRKNKPTKMTEKKIAVCVKNRKLAEQYDYVAKHCFTPESI